MTETVIEELVPPGARRVPRPRGERLLDVRGLVTSFHTRDGIVRAVDGIDFHVDRGEILGMAGLVGAGLYALHRLDPAPGRQPGAKRFSENLP